MVYWVKHCLASTRTQVQCPHTKPVLVMYTCTFLAMQRQTHRTLEACGPINLACMVKFQANERPCFKQKAEMGAAEVAWQVRSLLLF